MKVTSCESDCKMLDRKTEYEIEIPAASANDSFKISIEHGEMKVWSIDEEGEQPIELGSFDVRDGVHLSAMTTEYRDGTLYIRLPKGDSVRPRELQYSETITITPNEE